MGGRILPEAIVFLLDVGQHMSELTDEQHTFFYKSVSCIEKILQRKIFAESKDEIALVLFGTEETKNRLAQDDQYLNITEASLLQMVDWNLLEDVQNIKLSSTSADFLDALVVALTLLVEDSRGKKFSLMKIVLFSNFMVEFSTDQLDIIIDGMGKANIELNVVGPDLEDDEEDENDLYHSVDGNRPSKSVPCNHEAVKIIRTILKRTDGESYSFEEAIPSLLFFQKKNVRSVPWKVLLDIGPELQIPVLSYLKTCECKLKTWKNMYSRDENIPLQTEVSYHVNDEAQTEIDKDDCIPAYKYGKTLVPFSKEDQLNMKYQSPGKCLSVLGCTEISNVQRQNYMGDSIRIVVADSSDEHASVALSAIIHALHETNCALIVRYCYSAFSTPKLGFLAPRIKAESEYLLFGLLPFMDDLKHYTFPPLTAKQKFIPDDEQLQAVDSLITSMNLVVTTEENEEEEKFKPKKILNPYIQRLYQNLCFRALHPDEPLPEIEPHILQGLNPAHEIINNCSSHIKNIKRKFPLEVMLKKKAVRTGAEAFKDVDYENVSSIKDENTEGGLAGLAAGPVTAIGTITPVNDFNALLMKLGANHIQICKEMQNIIVKLVMDSPGFHYHIKAIDCLKALRAQSIKDCPDDFNQFMQKLKSDLQSSRKDFWNLIVKEKLGLITSVDNPSISLCPEEGTEYFNTDVVTAPEEDMMEEDVDDLLANM